MNKNIAVIKISSSNDSPEAEMSAHDILRMIARYAESKNLSVTYWDYVGSDYGIKSAIAVFDGDNAQQVLDSEQGIHRMVFNSPFDSKNRRFTTFTRVKSKVSYPLPNMGGPSPPEDFIRSYIIHPYTCAIDHRTNLETDDVADVLDGNIDILKSG